MAKLLFVALLAWAGLSLAVGAGFGGAEKKAAAILVYPILWVIGSIMLLAYIAASRLHRITHRAGSAN